MAVVVALAVFGDHEDEGFQGVWQGAEGVLLVAGPEAVRKSMSLLWGEGAAFGGGVQVH